MGDLKMFEEEIIFDTAADDDLELTSKDDIFLEDALCVPFSTSLFPHHDQGIIQDALRESTLQDVLCGFVSPSSQFVVGKSSAPLPDCFHQVPKLIHPEHNLTSFSGTEQIRSVGESKPHKIIGCLDMHIILFRAEQIGSVARGSNPWHIHRDQYQPAPTESNHWHHPHEDSTNY